MLTLKDWAEQGRALAICCCCAGHCCVRLKLGTCCCLQELPSVLGSAHRSNCQYPGRCCRVTASEDQQHRAPRLLRGLQTCMTPSSVV